MYMRYPEWTVHGVGRQNSGSQGLGERNEAYCLERISDELLNMFWRWGMVVTDKTVKVLHAIGWHLRIINMCSLVFMNSSYSHSCDVSHASPFWTWGVLKPADSVSVCRPCLEALILWGGWSPLQDSLLIIGDTWTFWTRVMWLAQNSQEAIGLHPEWLGLFMRGSLGSLLFLCYFQKQRGLCFKSASTGNCPGVFDCTCFLQKGFRSLYLKNSGSWRCLRAAFCFLFIMLCLVSFWMLCHSVPWTQCALDAVLQCALVLLFLAREDVFVCLIFDWAVLTCISVKLLLSRDHVLEPLDWKVFQRHRLDTRSLF